MNKRIEGRHGSITLGEKSIMVYWSNALCSFPLVVSFNEGFFLKVLLFRLRIGDMK